MANFAVSELGRVRRERGIKQRALAGALGVHPSCLCQVENLHRRPWPKLRRDASRLLGVPEGELFPEEAAPARVATGGSP